ncbi:hypothetical protein SUGI_0339440 [Cryptomeria japonica]|uniref:disease resistance protein RUN1-like n=1 Tax=Cryptomeria japonica TaxID=3369 RepID=UPI002408950E|nr:disease resistance protein RUN1-like [Cryptomeria japonica]GLJ18986.1 hypothetical protein SUGI_0339440 [Cryptomeria japonica]
MDKFCFPSSRFSCTCFLSSSTSQEEAIAGLESFLEKMKDIDELHDLIRFIEELVMTTSGEKNEEGFSSALSSYTQDGQLFLEFVDKHIGKLPQKKNFIDGLSAETGKILINMLKGAGKIHWVGAALSVVGFVLARYGEMSNNQRECLEILKAMVNLGKQIVELNEQMSEQKQKLNEAVECIVVGCIICTSQLTTTKFFRFLTASVNANTLKDFQLKIERLYNDLQLWGIIDIQTRLPKIAPQSQELYANQGAVGIESARDEVIRLLDSTEKHASARVVVVHGFGGIGKTTLADAVYAHIDLRSYKHCRIHMDQNCTKKDLKVLQEQILNELFHKNVKLYNCDQGRGMIRSLSIHNSNQPLFLYIDNGLKSTDLEKLLPADLGGWLPVKSRILVTTRNLHETNTFVSKNIERQQYAVSPLPEREGREILLKKVSDYNDEKNIHDLLRLCGGVPLLLELAGSQLAINSTSRNNIVLDMLRQGEKVEEKDISDRMVAFVYHRLPPPVQEAFLDITSFFSRGEYIIKYVVHSIGEVEFRALEEASFVKISGSSVVVHDIVRARGKKMSEGNRITDPEALSECLKEENLKNLKGIYFKEPFEQPPIEINENHLKCMSISLRVLHYAEASQITFKGKCDKPFKQLRCLSLPRDISDLPMEFEKLEHLLSYDGPLTQEMSLYKLPPSLRWMSITNIISSENRVAYSNILPGVAQGSSLVSLSFWPNPTMERLPDGIENLTKLEELDVRCCSKLKKLPSKIGELSNLEILNLSGCSGLEEWPSSLGALPKLKTLDLRSCSSKLKESLSHNIKDNCNFIE